MQISRFYIFYEFVSQELISSAIVTGVLLNLTCKVNHNKAFYLAL